MDISILELVLQTLQEAGFAAIAAYPGQKLPVITEPAAAAHIKKVDGESQTVTVEISILSPAALGGAACEQAALKAAKALQAAKALCIQSGCIYDGIAQVYSVSILAAFAGITGEKDCALGPGFQVFLDGVLQDWATAFTAEKVREQTVEFATRSPVAVAITSGSYYWNIHLEELIPSGFPETPEPEEEFSLKLIREGKTEIYSPCRWSSVTRSFRPEGLRRVRKGIALMREEEA